MNAIRYFLWRRVSSWYLLPISITVIVLGFIAGITNAQQKDQHPRFEFADDVKAFCVDEGRIDVGFMDVGENPTGGFATPEEAIENYVTELHQAASKDSAPEGIELPEELWLLLEPSRQFYVSERQDVDENLIYFDLPSSKAGVLEARLVVEHIGDGFHVTADFICETQLVSDPALYQQLLTKEMSRDENQ